MASSSISTTTSNTRRKTGQESSRSQSPATTAVILKSKPLASHAMLLLFVIVATITAVYMSTSFVVASAFVFNNNSYHHHSCLVPRLHQTSSSSSRLPMRYNNVPSNSAKEKNQKMSNFNSNISNSNIINNSNDFNKNLILLCWEIGCTMQQFRATKDELKRRKVRLSKERLAVEDQILLLAKAESKTKTATKEGTTDLELEATGGRFSAAAAAAESFQTTLGSAFSSIKSQLATDTTNTNMNTNIGQVANNGSGQPNSGPSTPNENSDSPEMTLLKQRQKDLSARALAIQNLLASLQWVEETGGKSSTSSSINGSINSISGSGNRPSAPTGNPQSREATRTGNVQQTIKATAILTEIVKRYRNILYTEGIALGAMTTNTKKKNNNWNNWNGNKNGKYDYKYESSEDNNNLEARDKNTEAPHPPYVPPTPLQFMNQYVSTIKRAANSSEGGDDDENPVTRMVQWFGKSRVDTNPFYDRPTDRLV